mmetsp:Transcript_20645/g.24831  ORF Transcript_20645/g.24831 Transcript_20645/m.24831 type:complete len:103 (+) Transcript_20645:2289-2597(+)
MLLFVDAHCCAVLREKALDVFRTNSNAVMASSGWTAVENSNELLQELMKVLTSQNDKRQDSSNLLEHMRVGKLRETLHEQGLDVDGTREMLVARLKEANDNP